VTNILKSEFVISTLGDRDDYYRHYECIVSNINDGYKDIFEENMVYSNANEMIKNKYINYLLIQIYILK
jgi:hypothetical protein